MSSSLVQKFRVEHAELTDLGMRRATNQDSVAVIVAEEGKRASRVGDLLIVADGMGAHAAGELASKLAVDTIPHAYQKLGDLAPQAALRKAVQEANTNIYIKGQSSPEFNGMGTTCSCLLVLNDKALVAHVGDSRVYRLRQGRLEQLTFDHSLVWEMAAASQTTAEQMPDCIPKNVITRSLGPRDQVNVDLEGPFDLANDDAFLLCSDGLTGVVEDELIGALLGAMPLEDAAQTLIDLANLRGGPDNITIAAARASATGKTESAPPSPPADSKDSSAPADQSLQTTDQGPRATDQSPQPADANSGSPDPVKRTAWLAMVGCLAAVAWFGSQSHPLGALLAAAGFGAAMMVAMRRRNQPPAAEPVVALGGPYGNGPYRSIDCLPGEPAAEALANVVQQLADLEHRDDLQIGPPVEDWSGFHRERQKAIDAANQGDPALAVSHFGAAIRGLMDKVRASRTTIFPSKDSVI